MKTQTSKTSDKLSLSRRALIEKVYERCVGCNELTSVKRRLHVDERPCYVRGAGQLCPDCWRRIYG